MALTPFDWTTTTTSDTAATSSDTAATLFDLTKSKEGFLYKNESNPDPRIIWRNSNPEVEEEDRFTFFLCECYGCKLLTTVYNIPEGYLYCKNCFCKLFDASQFSNADYEDYFVSIKSNLEKRYENAKKQAAEKYEECRKLKEELKQNKTKWEAYRAATVATSEKRSYQ